MKSIKVKGNMKYLFAPMDNETRYWIAQEVAQTKYTHDATHLFQMGKQRAGKQPFTLITDGLPDYKEAFRKEFEIPHARSVQPHYMGLKMVLSS